MIAELGALLQDLTKLDDIVWIVGPGPTVSENTPRGIRAPEIREGVVTIGAENWHFHLKLDAVSGVEFVEQDDPHHPKNGAMFYIRLLSERHGSPLRCYFPNPYLDERGMVTKFQPEKLKAFYGLRDKYIDRPGYALVQRIRQPAR